MLAKRLIKSNDAGGGACTNTVDLYNPFPDGGGVALYQLNGDATDVSGNYNGTASNVTYGVGEFGQAGVFNGSSSYIYNNVLDTSTTKSISIWVKANDFNDRWPFQQGDGQGVENYIRFYNTDDIQVRIGNVTQTFSGYNANTWYHIVAQTNTSGNANVWINGVEVGTSTAPTTLTVNRTNIGVRYNSAFGYEKYFNGSIDQVRIFSRALRPYEVEALYTEEYCTPTIVPSEHFNTVIYTGDGGVKSVTDVGFQPDFSWIKRRDGGTGYFHQLYDSVRGVEKVLFSNDSLQEYDRSNGLTSFDSNGFTLGDHPHSNESGGSYVAWNFKAGGAAVTNTDGTITSQVSANTEAGFSIITTTTNGSGYLNCGHGLGVKPDVVLIKSRDNASTWYMYHKGTSGTPEDDAMQLNSTSAVWDAGTYGADKWSLNDTVIASGTSQWYYQLSSSFVIYAFAEVEGFSSFGSYVGTGASGNTIVTGFEPAMIIIKRTDSIEDWKIIDNKRGFANSLEPNESIAEETGNNSNFVLSENGFTIGDTSGDYNANGGSYIYMAFAADPTTIEPTLEDSFNTVTYTGTGSTQSITGVGFQPDFVWTKSRESAYDHNVVDSVRGLGDNVLRALSTNLTDAENTTTSNNISSLDSDGFLVQGAGSRTNSAGQDYVAWNWKGAELPAINSNGSIPSIVSANPAAGFSIVSYSGNTVSGSTIGHGLGVAPNFFVIKSRSTAYNWSVYHSSVGENFKLLLNDNAAASATSNYVNTPPTSSVISLSGGTEVNRAANNYIAYCFAEVAGFSKFGSYTGSDGLGDNIITTDFEPAFLLIKNSTSAFDWVILDNKRSTTNPRNHRLFPNLSNAESVATSYDVDFLSTGFNVKGNATAINNSSNTYIYMAFANQF